MDKKGEEILQMRGEERMRGLGKGTGWKKEEKGCDEGEKASGEDEGKEMRIRLKRGKEGEEEEGEKRKRARGRDRGEKKG